MHIETRTFRLVVDARERKARLHLPPGIPATAKGNWVSAFAKALEDATVNSGAVSLPRQRGQSPEGYQKLIEAKTKDLQTQHVSIGFDSLPTLSPQERSDFFLHVMRFLQKNNMVKGYDVIGLDHVME